VSDIPAVPEGGFLVAIVTSCQPVEIGWRAYTADFGPDDLLMGSRGRYTPFDEDQANAIIRQAGHERTTGWQLFTDDGYRGEGGAWAAVVQPETTIGLGQ
jgi:hypothetical protein